MTIEGRLVAFLYDLLRDHVTPGVVEKIAQDATAETLFTNGWLARYAEDLATRLTTPAPPPELPAPDADRMDRLYAVRALFGDAWHEDATFSRHKIEEWIAHGTEDWTMTSLGDLVRVTALFADARRK